MAAPLIRYFRDCYEADNRRATISNIFKDGIEHRLFFEGQEELLNGDLPHFGMGAWGGGEEVFSKLLPHPHTLF